MADSDGGGASFYPDRGFVSGELVTVQTAMPILGGRAGTFTFRVDRADGPVPQALRSSAPRVPGDVQRFHSRPDLRPASVDITLPSPGESDIFLASMHGPLQWGPMIIDSHGSLVWFEPISGRRTVAAGFRVQEYLGHPVLTWWQGIQNYGDPGPNQGVILNRSYRTIATVRAGNGLTADLHEFSITPQNTALITAYRRVYVNASRAGGPQRRLVANCYVQEIDVPTGNVMFQWDSLDHVPTADAYMDPALPEYFDDYFHINSVEQDVDGNFVISARNTWAVYKIDHRTGRILWELGGKHSSFKMGPGTRTALQHDATIHPGGLITIFDNGDWPEVHPESRVVLERIDPARHTATLVRELDHSPSLLTPWEGSAQLLPGGQVFVGWGGLPQFTQFDSSGRQVFDGRFTAPTSSYRAYTHTWNAQPSTRPSVAVSRTGATTAVYASWNGATDVSQWRVLAGDKPTSLTLIAASPRSGFETSLYLHTGRRYFAVQAISGSGRVLSESRIIRARG